MFQVREERVDRKVTKAMSDLLEKMVDQERTVSTELTEPQVLKVEKEMPETAVISELMEALACLDHKETREPRDPKEHLDHLVPTGAPAYLEHEEIKEMLDPLEPLVKQEPMAGSDRRATRDKWDGTVWQDRQENKENKVILDHLDPKDRLDLKVALELKASQDLRVTPDQKALLEIKARSETKDGLETQETTVFPVTLD